MSRDLSRPPSGATEPQVLFSNGDGRNRRLLIVQQSAEVRSAWRRGLADMYAEVLVASDPEEATAMLNASEGEVDVVCGWRFLTETGCVVVPGTDWLLRFRRQGRVNCVVVTSASPPEQCPEGVDAVFRKPVDTRELLAFLVTSQTTPCSAA